jgi:sulfate/thiosulfate transport system substrate-binding protein
MASESQVTARLRRGFLLLGAGGLLLYAFWPWLPLPGREAPPRTAVFYGFSILGEVMNEDVLPAFARHWRETTGERIEFVTAFAGSGTVTNQLILGVPAHCALLSLELDAERLAAAGVIPAGSWRRLPHDGVVNRSPFVLLVRPGNPKGIRDFSDLARPGVRVVHPDPLTSGGANWALLAEYGAAARRSRGEGREAGFQALLGIWRNVSAQAASARGARTQFEQGFGDALVTYEQELVEDAVQGTLSGEIVYPPSTVLSEHTLVIVDKNIAASERPLIDALVRFLWSEEAQRLFVRRGFRSVDDRLNAANSAFGDIPDPFLVRDFGGWQRVKRDIVDGIWKDRVMREVGK